MFVLGLRPFPDLEGKSFGHLSLLTVRVNQLVPSAQLVGQRLCRQLYDQIQQYELTTPLSIRHLSQFSIHLNETKHNGCFLFTIRHKSSTIVMEFINLHKQTRFSSSLIKIVQVFRIPAENTRRNKTYMER